MSAIFDKARAQWAEMKEEWDRYVEVLYNMALEDCGGVLVNRLGQAKGIDGYSLFTGPWLRAKKYASEELLEFWNQNGRMTMTQFEEQWVEGTL